MSHNLFDDVIYNKIPSNTFDGLSHDRKFSFNMGELTPFFCQEVVPGDSFNIQVEQMIRMAPMVSPVMHKVCVKKEFFFVPNRLLWQGWEDFISNPSDPSNPAPFIKMSNMAEGVTTIEQGSMMDYLGYPTGVVDVNRKYNPFPLSATTLIYNEFYRDQNLQGEPFPFELVDGLNDLTTNPLLGNSILNYNSAGSVLKRAWNKDYFTSALPFPQKGEPVTIGLAGTAEVNYKADGETYLRRQDGTLLQEDGFPLMTNSLGTIVAFDATESDEAHIDNSENLIVDLETSTGITIENLRRAVRLQEWLEINARSGNRYIETLLNHFGVRSDDARLQRPEFLGGSKDYISFSEVLQTSSSDAETPQGNMAGHGINVGNTRTGKYCKEHGFIIGFITVIPETSYVNTTPKWATRLDPLDYMWSKFAQLGEQPVYNYEVKGDYGAGGDDVFGYQSRYAEYKYAHNTVHGDFKGNLDFWHMGRKFETDPVLNSDFIISDPTTRIFAVEDPDVDKLYCQAYFRVRCRRALPMYNQPTL